MPEMSFADLRTRYRMLMDGVVDYAIIMIDRDGKISDWNVGAEQIFGYGRTEVLDQAASLIFTTEDKQHHVPEREIECAVANGRADDERWHVRKDSSRFLASGVLTAMRDDDGQLQGFVKILRDNTERQNAAQLLQRAQRFETISVLAGGVAHKFNNLLTSVLGNTSLALWDLPEESDTRPLLQQVMDAGQRAADLTRQLLAYAGIGQFVRQTVDLSGLIAAKTVLLESLLSTSAKLNLELAPDLPPVEGDPGQLEQMVVSLVINAVEAIGDRDGTVLIATQSLDLARADVEALGITELEPGTFVVCTVSDTGHGIDEATQRKIFGPFFTTRFPGRGLGLAAVLGSVRTHKGAVRVRSTVGSGSAFQIYLPAQNGRTA